MTDPVALSVAPAQVAASGASRPPVAAQFEPAETKMFAHMMQGAPAQASTSAGPPSALRDAAMAVATQFGGNVRSFEDVRRSMLASIDLGDPVKTMFVMTDHAMETQMMFSKLHIASSLASAATSLFGTLLKNQQ